ncbi:hypothetical protein E4U43_007683 [Claviceps pusilla]|uniref:Uncharacterized protein n=1 Tax=Claviceps pusilla TaxID=123648 RepID=A0A9P7NEJ0_9HYPO|nr:hypothetical protein E4U43_007683 [Claviceps pusilla]
MLRRNSTRSVQKRPLSRSKSANSITQRSVISRLSIDSALLAERDAHIAANLSYHRAHCCHKHVVQTSCSCQESGQTTMLRRSTSVDGRLERKTNESSKKKQSVRFTGPTAKPRRQLASRAKPVVRESSIFMANDDGPSGQDVVGAGVQVHAVLKLNDAHNAHTVASTTYLGGSKHRTTLRRSKSMYSESTTRATPTYGGSYTESVSVQQQYPEVSLILPIQAREDEKLQFSIRRSLRAPKSMSYLDYQMNQTGIGNGEMKRDGLLGPVKKHSSKGGGGSSFHRLKSHSSMFFRGKQRRQESSMETSRSCRNSSDHSAALSSVFSGGNHVVPAEKSSGLRFTARRVSKTVKHKLSKLFGRPKSGDASGNEMGTANVLLHDTGSESYRGHPANENGSEFVEEASMSRVTSYVPSLHAVPSHQQMRSRQGSLESIQQYEEQMDLDQKSRITSWTNSTVNTIVSYEEDEEREFQRLSVIKENGMHVPSSSRTGSRDEPTTAAAYSHGIRGPNLVIDSQRVYSALMKKLKADMSTDGDGSPKRSRCPRQVSSKTVPPRQSSLDRADAWSPRTVRDVGTEEDDVFEDSKEFASLRVPSSSMSNKPEAGEGLCGDGISRGAAAAAAAAYKAYPHPAAGDGKGLSPNPKASMTESASKQSCVQAGRNSTFSPSPNSFLFRTKSPYRRALQRSIQEQQATGHTHALDTRYLSTLSALTLPTRCPSTLGSERDVRLTYAESFYSFTSEDLTSSQPPEVASNPIMEEDAEDDVEENVEQAQPTDTEGHATETPSQRRDISSATSVEWKTWLSAHVCKREEQHTKMASSSTEEAATGGFGGLGTPAGHVRENAEIESPAEVPKSTGSRTMECVLPTEMEGGVNSLEQESSLACPGNTNGTPGMFPNDVTNDGILVDKKETEDGSLLATPPVPCRNVLRTVTSLPNVKNEDASGLVKRKKGITHRRSLNNIPTWVPLTQDGTHWERRGQENERRDSPSLRNSTPGQSSTITRQDCLDTKTGSPLRCKTRAMKRPQIHTPVGPAIGIGTGTGTGPVPGRGTVPDTVKSEWDAQVRGSRRMVDLFLSSRRRAIEGPMSRNGSDNYSAAFL